MGYEQLEYRIKCLREALEELTIEARNTGKGLNYRWVHQVASDALRHDDRMSPEDGIGSLDSIEQSQHEEEE